MKKTRKNAFKKKIQAVKMKKIKIFMFKMKKFNLININNNLKNLQEKNI